MQLFVSVPSRSDIALGHRALAPSSQVGKTVDFFMFLPA